jgi:pimeloyl-ACP methyl ester carboxylesterase
MSGVSGRVSVPQRRDARVAIDERPDRSLWTLALVRDEGGGEHYHCGDLSRITAPTLILESKYDGSKDPCHATYAADHIPNAELFLSPAESHLFWFSPHDPEIRAKMQEFLQS